MSGAQELPDLAASMIARATPDEQLEVYVSRGRSTTVNAYDGEVESLRSGTSQAIGVRVIVAGRQGFASAGSLDPDVVADTLAEARENLQFAEVDPHQGLAEPDGVPEPGLDLVDRAVLSVTEDEKIEMAIDLERRCFAADQRVSGVRTSAWSDGWGEAALASTAGISVYSEGGSCSVGVQPLAVEGDETQIGYGGDAARRPDQLDLDKVIADAVEGATGLLGATKPQSERVTVVFEPSVAAAFLGTVAGSLTGDRVLKGRSPFAERVGEDIAVSGLTLIDDPTDPRSLGADNHDGEGLASRRNVLIDAGTLGGFLHNSYTARRAGVASTGSAVRGARSTPGVGLHAMTILPGELDRDAVLAAVGEGIFVRGVNGLHSGVNPVSGDFSVGAYGHRISGGALGEPFREATIASTLQRMLLDLVIVGGDFAFLPGGTGMASLAIADISLSGT
ncbi:MAG: TldD/PmbA family protein [Actinomycetota bacterium]|jgi:PmbA protein|nr:TldD/PmbA family protein [Actinomycetota bacterium]